MDDLNPASDESISALVDGYLAPQTFERTLSHVLDDAEAQRDWHCYQVLGDVLRSTELAPHSSGTAFWQRLEQRLQQEPMDTPAPPAPVPAHVQSRPSANHRFFQHRFFKRGPMAAVAGVALVGVVVLRLGPATTEPAAVPVAVVPAPAVVADNTPGAPVILRDPQLDALLAAHRQFGGHSALQLPSGFLRNATFEEPRR